LVVAVELLSIIFQWIVLLVIFFGGFGLIVIGCILNEDGFDGTAVVFWFFGAVWELLIGTLLIVTR